MPSTFVRKPLVAVGLAMVAASVLAIVALLASMADATVDGGTAALGIGVFGALPLAVGAGLVWAGDHALPGRWLLATRVAAARGLAAIARPATWRALLSSSFGRAGLGAMVIVAAALVTRKAGPIGLTAFFALTAYSILDPLLFACQRGRWLGLAGRSIAGFVLLFVACTPAGAALGEGGMIFLFPFFVYPPALAVGGALRLVLNLRARSSAPHE